MESRRTEPRDALFERIPVPWERTDESTGVDIDGERPAVICAPGTVEEAAAALRWADQAGLAVAPLGGGSRLDLGNRPRRLDLGLTTRGISRVLEYEPANLTVTVETGSSLAHLQAVLGEHGQFLPLDLPHADRTTIGGMLAANASGPSRLGYGSARDLVVGMTVILADGRITRSGGKVVKNVAGYDLNKLYIGSLGTLGVIAEATFKVTPRPARAETVIARFADAAAAGAVVQRILHSSLAPVAVELLDAEGSRAVATASGVDLPAVEEREVLLAVLAAGPEGAVKRQVRDLLDSVRQGDGACDRATDGDGATGRWGGLWNAIRELTGASDSALRLKIAVPIARVPDVFAALARVPPLPLGEGRGEGRPRVVAHAGSGIVYASWAADGDGANPAPDPKSAICNLQSAIPVAPSQAPAAAIGVCTTLVADLRRLVRGAGSVVVERAPLALKGQLDVWGYDGDALAVMRRIKQHFDPNATLNPGRFVDGI
ncbi:MAG: FAD-binding oxidoreductase [Chloroflexi bacterium]|nr:FAD-binding oxidoreductase [Chloroflexota bacterium]